MDERTTVDRGVDDEFELAEAGSTYVFGVDGWEAIDYVDPTPEWSLQPDGSFVSPEGTTRTWPLETPESA